MHRARSVDDLNQGRFGAFIAGWVGYWVILFTGKLPEGIHTFVTGVFRWGARVGAWITSLTDRYPPFTLD